MLIRILFILLILFSPYSWSHKSSDSYVNIMVTEQTIIGRWDIALRDLEYALGLDSDNDGSIIWSELKHRKQEIENYAFAHFRIYSEDIECQQKSGILQVDKHSDGTYAVLNFTANCPTPIEKITVEYQFLFDLDPTHRGLIQISKGENSELHVFSPEKMSADINLDKSNQWQTFRQFITEGIWHIWIGYDHILFLICLLLPSVVKKTAIGWEQNNDLKKILFQVTKIVTAFTLAHSITLLLAVFEVINLPTRLVESSIALSVILVAANNLYAFFNERAWFVAFAFGLIHGFGFASVLTALNLTPGNLGISLLGFNLGVEMGQLAIVSVFLPIAFCLRRFWIYQRLLVSGGSISIMLLATVWFMQRAFDLRILDT